MLDETEVKKREGYYFQAKSRNRHMTGITTMVDQKRMLGYNCGNNP